MEELKRNKKPLLSKRVGVIIVVVLVIFVSYWTTVRPVFVHRHCAHWAYDVAKDKDTGKLKQQSYDTYNMAYKICLQRTVF